MKKPKGKRHNSGTVEGREKRKLKNEEIDEERVKIEESEEKKKRNSQSK